MVDLATVKEWLGIEDTDSDAELDALRLRAIETVQRSLDWYFGDPRPTQEILNGANRSPLYLRQPPVNGVTVYDRSGPTDEWVEVDAEDYEQDGRGIFHATYWPKGFRNVRVDYDEGFVNAPGDVVQLTLDLIESKWDREAHAGVRSETLGRYSYTLADLQELPSWSSTLNNWKRGKI